MPDNSYQPGVYREQGGDKLVVATAGSIAIDGGSMTLSSGTAGGSLTIAAGGNMSIAALATLALSGNLNALSGSVLAVAAGSIVTLATGSKMVRNVRLATQSLTMTAANSGQTVINNVVASIFTLPSATNVGKGIEYTFCVGAVATSGVNALTVRPAANDKIRGGSVSGATDSETISFAGADDDEGDYVRVLSDGATGWFITGIDGTITRAAAT